MALDYAFEHLDPEHFQLFCQSLVLREHPDFQALPVAHRDGGRDGIVFLRDKAERNSLIVQVKYHHKPLSVTDPHKWVLTTLEGELPKIARLVSQAGVESYLFITNVPGTAVPETGSIDLANKLLSAGLEIAARAWWRNDLARRLDNAPELRWAFPQLLTAHDLLRTLIEESGYGRSYKRISAAVRAAAGAQISEDDIVRFKQVDLQAGLFDLMVDPPMVIERVSNRRPGLATGAERDAAATNLVALFFTNWRMALLDPEWHGDEHPPFARRAGVTAIRTLTHPFVASAIPLVLLEAGPGQGKSTLVQYLCQLYRYVLLGYKVPGDVHPNRSASRVPFRLDLRDLATWLDGGDPYTASDRHASPQTATAGAMRGPQAEPRSIESLVSYQITLASGGTDFSVEDLHELARVAPTFFALDGLDEVAERSQRDAVVEEIIRFVSRLQATALSPLVVVTTRPVVSQHDPQFYKAGFAYCRLVPLQQQHILEYAAKWTVARKLNPRDASELRLALDRRLGEPHLRELARNPMQLAILLTLIHTRGQALPDKRTALYDSYMDLFLARESEKSEVVRTHRELLIDIHRFLAWYLHLASERGRTRAGRIERDELLRILAHYLEMEGHDPQSAEQLFTAVTERIFAIVSRAQGTFEFEVQPVREYFAARFLNDTAPLSTPGTESSDSKPDRFDVVARNAYWLNVTRFLAGCASKGELPMLAERIDELAGDPTYRQTPRARGLAWLLLMDWVFAQNRRVQRQVAELICDRDGLRILLSTYPELVFGDGPDDRQMALSAENGGTEIGRAAFGLLESTFMSREYSQQLAQLVASQGARYDDEWCNVLQRCSAHERVDWLRVGYFIGALGRCSRAVVERIVEDSVERSTIGWVALAGHVGVIEENASAAKVAVEMLLSGDMTLMRSRRGSTYLLTLGRAVSRHVYQGALDRPGLDSLSKVWSTSDAPAEVHPLSDGVPAPVAQFIHRWRTLADRSTQAWATDAGVWSEFIAAIDESFSNGPWIARELAMLAAHVDRRSRQRAPFRLSDADASLYARVRFAVTRHSDPEWWAEQIADNVEQSLVVACCFAWASVPVLRTLQSLIGERLEALSDREHTRIVQAIAAGLTYARRRPPGESEMQELIDECPVAMLPYLDVRLRRPELLARVYPRLVDARGTALSNVELRLAASHAIDHLGELHSGKTVEESLKIDLEIVRQAGRKNLFQDHRATYRWRPIMGSWRHTRLSELGRWTDVVDQVLADPISYPGDLVAASARAREAAADAGAPTVADAVLGRGWSIPGPGLLPRAMARKRRLRRKG